MMQTHLTTFKEYLKTVTEETASGDIATVDNRLGSVRWAGSAGPKMCKVHNVLDCKICNDKKDIT